MLDHMGFRVRDLAAARRFYDACTAALASASIDNSAAITSKPACARRAGRYEACAEASGTPPAALISTRAER